MNKIFYALFTLFLFATSSVTAQQRNLTLEEAVLGPYKQFAPVTLKQLQWCGDADNLYAYLKDDTLLVQGEAGSSEHKILLTLGKLNNALKSQGLSECTRFPSVQWEKMNVIRFRKASVVVCLNLSENKIEQLIRFPQSAQNFDFSAKGNAIAYTLENNLFLAREGGEKVAITNDRQPGIINGQSVHRREFGITKGTFWSPAGKYLAFYQKDETMVKDYPLVDYMVRQAESQSIKYPMAGMTSHEVKVGVYNVQSCQTVFLQTGEPFDHYLTNVTWGPDEKYLYIAELNREQTHMRFNQYEAATGEFIKTLFDEQHPKYVQPMHPAIFSKKKKNEFYWMSRTAGYNHIYKYNTEGKLLAQITAGNWEVTGFIGIDAKEQNLYFIATKESPVERHIYKVNLKSQTLIRLDKADGIHTARLSTNGNFLIDQYSNKETPNNIELLSTRGKKMQTLLTAEDPAAEIQFGENVIFPLKAADDSTDLYSRMIKPANFNPRNKYPVIVCVYGGPLVQMVYNCWHNNSRWWQYYMAQKGYIVFTVDNRGSANRGLKFENVIHRRLGENEMADQMKGVDYLKSLPYVNANRIGVHGWSYGGYMTINLMLTHPETFKVGVAGGAVTDWKMYEVMYGERYMDTPEENPEGYKAFSLLKKADKLQGKLLMIHGARDDVVVMQHTMQFVNQCITRQKQVDLFIYPTAKHNVFGPDRVHLMQKTTDYFEKKL